MSTITKLSPEVIQYYMNITSLICAIARIQVDVQVWTVQRQAQSHNRKTLEPNNGAWKDGAPDGLLEIHATAAPLWSATGRIHTLQAPWPGHEDPGESDETPQASGEAKAKWRARVSISKAINQIKPRTSKSDCMVSDHGSIRLVRRRNNPNKETLIYIPLSHVTIIQAHTTRLYSGHDKIMNRRQVDTRDKAGYEQLI